MIAIALLALIGLVSGQMCEFSGGPTNQYTLNLTSINRLRMEYKEPTASRNYYYTPCRNGESCAQGSATFYGNVVQYGPQNQCYHWLSVDHQEPPSYFLGGASWEFSYRDGQICDVTQQPREVNIWYQCDEAMTSGAWMYDVDEDRTCHYNTVIRSPLACVPENSHNANCQWRVQDFNNQSQYYYLDLSSQKGAVIRDQRTENNYRHYYTPCQNGLPCYQQSGSMQVMSVLENDATHTCEHYLAVWQEGRVHPTFHRHADDPKRTHWSFHYWLSQKCTSGFQGEETIRWYCDPDVANYTLLNATYDGDCRWEMNIASALACPEDDMYHVHNGVRLEDITAKINFSKM